MTKAFIGNIGGNSFVPKLKGIFKQFEPQIGVITEAHRADRLLKSFPDYQHQRLTVEGFDTSVAVLVREDCLWEYSDEVVMNEGWEGLHRFRPMPRLYMKGRIQLPNHKELRYFGAHFEPFGPRGKNEKAWKESMEAANDWLDNVNPSVRPSLLMGDLNARVRDVRLRTPYTVHQGGKVSHFISRGLTDFRVRRFLRTPHDTHGWALASFHLK